MKTFFAAAFSLGLLALLLAGLYFYGKFMANNLIKQARNGVEKGNLSDQKLLSLYKQYKNTSYALFWIFFTPLVYFPIKNAYPIIKDIYQAEIQKRNLPLP